MNNTDLLVKELAIKLFKRFRFHPGVDPGGRHLPSMAAWGIPPKQVKFARPGAYHDEWLIFCPWLELGGYEPLINVVEQQIAANLAFYMAASSEKTH